MLLPEQMGWTFHRVCMKEASTWMLPLEMDKCCRRKGNIVYLFAYIHTSDSTGAELSKTIRGQRWKQQHSTFLFNRMKLFNTMTL